MMTIEQLICPNPNCESENTKKWYAYAPIVEPWGTPLTNIKHTPHYCLDCGTQREEALE